MAAGGSFHTFTHIMLCKSTLWKELESLFQWFPLRSGLGRDGRETYFPLSFCTIWNKNFLTCLCISFYPPRSPLSLPTNTHTHARTYIHIHAHFSEHSNVSPGVWLCSDRDQPVLMVFNAYWICAVILGVLQASGPCHPSWCWWIKPPSAVETEALAK